MRIAIRVGLLALGGALSAQTAMAHPLAPSLLSLEEHADGRVAARWRTPLLRPPGDRAQPVLAGCEPLGEVLGEERSGGAELHWTAICPGGLAGRRLALRGAAPGGSDTLVRVRLADGRRFQQVVRAKGAGWVVPERPSALAVAGSYTALGARHIAAGLDHLAFVLTLVLLVRSRRQLLWTVTAFTAGHSLTLAAAVLGWIRTPAGWVELAIAASVLVLAVELARGGRPRGVAVPAAAGFGLLHGLGFAGALAGAGLPQGEIPLALLAFNVGIELGQLAFVALVLVAGQLLRGLPQPGLRRAAAYGIGALAGLWFWQRLAALV